MYNRFLSFLLLPSFYISLFVTFSVIDVYGMSGKELSKDRQAWLLKAHQEVPKNIKTMNDGVEGTAITVFKALANDDYKEMDDQAVTDNLDNAVKAATQVASTIRIMSEDSSEKFKPEWQGKKRTTKYAKDTVELLNDPKKGSEYSGKKLSALKKKYAKGKEQPTCAHWKPNKLPENTKEEVFWNPSGEMTNQDDVGCSLRRLGKEVFEDSKNIDKQNKKFAEKEEKVKKLKEANLVWKREDGKQSKQETNDGKEHRSEKKSKENNDEIELITEQQFSDSFAKIITYHNYALARAAFHMKELPDKKKDIPNMLNCLYQAQAIKNALFSLPSYYEAKNKESKFYVDMKHLGIADDLYIVHRFLADEKEHQSIIDDSLPKKAWATFGCIVAKEVLKDPSTIKSLLKEGSLLPILNSEAMQRYAVDDEKLAMVYRALKDISKCVDFFDNHTYLKTIIAPFGKYLARPALMSIVSLIQNRLTHKKEEDKPNLLQNSLDGFALSLKEEYQKTKKVPNADNETESYVEFLLKRTSLKDDSVAIPLSKEKAISLKEECQKRLIEIEKELITFEHYCSTGYKATPEDEQILEKLTARQKELKAEIKRADYWLQFHGEKVEKSKDSAVTPIDIVSRNYEQRKKELCEQNSKLYESDLYDHDKAQAELEKETRVYKDRLRQSKVFYAPEEFLFPNKDNKKQIRTFIKKYSDEYRDLLIAHNDLLATLGISTETFLSLYVKAKLNKEYGALISHYENTQEKFAQKQQEKKHLEGEQEKIKKESETFAKRSFRAPKRFFSFIYSFFVKKYNQWRMGRNESAQKQVNDEVEALSIQLRELEQYKEYKAFEQMFHDKNHARYVQDAHLEEKVKILASKCDSIFEYALWPDKRMKKQSASEILEKRKHRTPLLQEPLVLPSFIRIGVPEQNGKMDCALRSLINVNYILEHDKEKQFACDETYKERLEVLRSSSPEESWLKEDTVKDLIDAHYPDKGLIFIPSIYYFKEMRSYLDRDTLEHLSTLQIKLKSTADFSQGLVLGTMRQNGDIQNGGHDASGHYVALVFQRKAGNLSIKFANSMPFYSCDDAVTTLLEVLKKYDFSNVVSSKDSTRVCDLLSQLDCRKIFIDKKLNQNISQKSSDGVMQNEKDIPEIIDDMLNASSELLYLTNGKAMWTSSGFKDIKVLILESLDVLEHSHKKLIKVEPKGVEEFVSLNDIQKETISVLRHCIETAKS